MKRSKFTGEESWKSYRTALCQFSIFIPNWGLLYVLWMSSFSRPKCSLQNPQMLKLTIQTYFILTLCCFHLATHFFIKTSYTYTVTFFLNSARVTRSKYITIRFVVRSWKSTTGFRNCAQNVNHFHVSQSYNNISMHYSRALCNTVYKLVSSSIMGSVDNSSTNNQSD